MSTVLRARDEAPSWRPVPHRPVIRALAVALALLLALVGCSRDSGVDQVTVEAGPTSITVPTALSCSTTPDGGGMLCDGGETDDDAPHLSLGPGTPLTVKVPEKVGDTPWVIVFSYTDADGDTHGDRTSVFPPKDRYSYHLETPKGAQLTRLEVQSLYATPGQDGQVEFPAVQTWVVVVDPLTGS